MNTALPGAFWKAPITAAVLLMGALVSFGCGSSSGGADDGGSDAGIDRAVGTGGSVDAGTGGMGGGGAGGNPAAGTGGTGSGGAGGNPGAGGSPGTITDPRDGTTYKTVVIGSQTWMAQNLSYTPTTGNSWCYDDQASNCATYGRIYDWATVMQLATTYNKSLWGGSGVKYQGICPSGWHVSSDAEWTLLDSYTEYDVSKLRTTSGWPTGSPGTDDYGFSALPGGTRNGVGDYFSIGEKAAWWTSTEDDAEMAKYEMMDNSPSGLSHVGSYKTLGRSVRCLKD